MPVSVSEYAARQNISPRRVQAMIRDGQLTADRIGGRYVIADRELNRSPNVARPMSARMAWAFIDVLSGDKPRGVSANERVRLRAREGKLRGSSSPAQLLRSWLSGRAERQEYRIAPADIVDFRSDPRFHASGISDERSFLSAASEAEGYVIREDLDELAEDFLLIESDAPNVFLHVCEAEYVARAGGIGALLADLAEHRGPREDGRVESILREGR